MKQRQWPIVLISLSLGLLLDFLFYGQTLGINVFVSSMLLLSSTAVLAKLFSIKLSQSFYTVAATCLFFALMTALRTSPLMLFLNFSAVIYLLLLAVQLVVVSPASLKNFSAQNYLSPLLSVPINSLASLPNFLGNLVKNLNRPIGSKRNVTPVIRGIVLALPILIIFIALFASADPVFRSYISPIFKLDFELSPVLRQHLFIIGLLSSICMSVFVLLFTTNKSVQVATKRKPTYLGLTELYIILGSVALLFLVFILIQVTYLFGGENNVLSSGLTYAQYARKGFFELLAVSAITLILIRLLDGRSVRRTMQQKVIFMWLTGLLILEVLLIMLSALKRLSLYESTYGFTVPRLIGHLFIFWLAVAFGLLLIHIFREETSRQFAFRIFISVLLFLAILNFINPDAQIARQNLKHFTSSKKIDQIYIANLSEDATPAIAAELNNPDKAVAQTAESILAIQRQKSSYRSRSWRSHNASHNKAVKIFRDNTERLNKYPYERW